MQVFLFDHHYTLKMQQKRLQKLYIRISIGRYHFLKFILEGYDGLALLTRLENNLVVLRYSDKCHKDLMQLLASLAPKIYSVDRFLKAEKCPV